MKTNTPDICPICKKDLTELSRLLGSSAIEFHMRRHQLLFAKQQGYQEGYFKALEDYSIWNNGVQRIGAMFTDIKDIKERFSKDPRNNPYAEG